VTGTATFSHQVQQGLAFNWTLNIAFPANSFIAGKTFRFNNGRNQQQDATVPVGQTIPNPLYGQTGEYSADILGSGVLIPEYADNPVILPGMLFTGIVTDGGVDYPFSGRIANKIGKRLLAAGWLWISQCGRGCGCAAGPHRFEPDDE
jgi:hypothetical protein